MTSPKSSSYSTGFDPGDGVHLTMAIAGKAGALITGNIRDFTQPFYQSAEVLTRQAFVDRNADGAPSDPATVAFGVRFVDPCSSSAASAVWKIGGRAPIDAVDPAHPLVSPAATNFCTNAGRRSLVGCSARGPQPAARFSAMA